MPDQVTVPVVLPDSSRTLRVMSMPANSNQHGDVFGGWIMSQADIAGAVVGMRRARGRVATVSVDSSSFKQPISVGGLFSFLGKNCHDRSLFDQGGCRDIRRTRSIATGNRQNCRGRSDLHSNKPTRCQARAAKHRTIRCS